METISFGGRSVAGFGLGAPASGASAWYGVVASPAYASLMSGAAAGLLAYTLRAPVWGAVLIGTAGAVATKIGIDKAASSSTA